MIERIDKVLGGKLYRITTGTDEQLNFVTYMQGPHDEVTGQPTLYVPLNLNISFGIPNQVQIDAQGVITLAEGTQKAIINTTWRRLELSNTGNKVMGFSDDPDETNHPDLQSFTVGIGQPIRRSMVNGKIRNGLGFNYLPAFAPDGSVLTFTPEQEAAAPSFDYATHHADGTPINPKTEIADDTF